jgi:hypothetical protein
MKLAYDVNGGVGGPIKRDKLWFFRSVRFQDNESLVAGGYPTRTAGTTAGCTSGHATQGVFFTKQKNVNGRLTYQATRRTRSRSTATSSGATGTTRVPFMRPRR